MHHFGRAMRAEWPLDPQITYLNHGTVGVTPRRVLAAQRISAEIYNHLDEVERLAAAVLRPRTPGFGQA